MFIQPGLLQEPEVCADPFTRCRFVCGMGSTVQTPYHACKHFRWFYCDTDYLLSYALFLLAKMPAMYHTGAMKNPDPNKVEGIRLPTSYWKKFRAIWQGGNGRAKLLRWIDREYKRLTIKEPS